MRPGMKGSNDNFPSSELADRVIGQALAITGRHKTISGLAWSIAIEDQIELAYGVPACVVRSMLDAMTVTPDELMAQDDAPLVLHGMGIALQEEIDRYRNRIRP